MHNSIDTVNAAAAAIAAAEIRVQQVTSQRRRWGGCLSAYWCFGDTHNIRRIAHASFSSHDATPLPVPARAASPELAARAPSNITMPFIAPPTSPTSTGPPSVVHTPPGLLSIEACPAAAPMFAVGPYAYETQLVSPPAFSAFTTEPSTACRTPQEQDLSSQPLPELPLSQLLLSSLDSNLVRRGYPRQQPAVCSSSGASTPFVVYYESCSSSGNATQQASRLNSVQMDYRMQAGGLAQEDHDPEIEHSIPREDERPESDSNPDAADQSIDPDDNLTAKRRECDGVCDHASKCESKLQSLAVLLNEAW